MKYKLTLLIVILLLNLPVIYAQTDDVTITRDIQKQIRYGNELKISLSLTNSLQEKKTLELRERLPLNVKLIQPNEPSERKNFNAVEVSFLVWNLQLDAGQKKIVSYIIKPEKVGEYTIIGSEAIDPVTSKTYNGIQSQFDVLCLPDNVCNLDIGENFQTCQSDCPTGLQDGICNAILDNQCDLDCTKDPDCKDKGFNIFYIIIPIIIIGIIALIYFFKKPKQGIPEQEQQEQQKQDQRPQQPKQPESILYS